MSDINQDTQQQNNDNEEVFQDDVEIEFEDAEVEAQGKGDKMKKLRNELAEVKKEKEEYLTGWQKAKADYINLKNEQEQLRKDLGAHVRATCVQDLLPVLDSFEMAMKGEAWESVDKNWRTGVEYIRQQLQKVLEEYGVTEIADPNADFDPNLHDPMESEDEGTKIIEIIQKGYQMNGNVLRPAKVKLGK